MIHNTLRLGIVLSALIWVTLAPLQIALLPSAMAQSPTGDQTPPLGYPAVGVPPAYQKEAKELEKIKAEIRKTLTPAQIKSFKTIETKKNNATLVVMGKIETAFKKDANGAEPTDAMYKVAFEKFRPEYTKIYVNYATALRAASTKKQLPLINKYLTLDKLVADETEKALVEGKE
jgi:hypothetical protein